MEAQVHLTTSVSWEQLDTVTLNPVVLRVLKENNFTQMTPVQVHTLPLFCKYKDVAVQACTGSGKTLAFVIPLIEIILRALNNNTKFLSTQAAALVITPVRELAKQVKEVIDLFSEPLGMQSILLIGGTSPEEDRELLNAHIANPSKALIIVGTPGKLENSLYSSPQLFNTRQLEVLVMDEADSLLELGFQASLNKILQKLPKQRRTGLFSATQTKELGQLIRAGLRNPVQVNVTVNADEEGNQRQEQVIPVSLKNFYCRILPEEKLSQLVHLLTNNANCKIICYFLTCAQVNYFWTLITLRQVLAKYPALVEAKVKLNSLHGKVPHEKRKGIYENFIQQDAGVLFTTDVAARGLDFPDVDWVVQFDAPQQPDQFVHRIGRTARMGKSGNAVVFLTEDQEDYIEFLRHKSIPIEEMTKFENVEDVSQSLQEQQCKQREVFDKAQLAFVSFIRAYKEHACSYIFRLNRMDLGNYANGFGLLVLPKMPELSNPNRTVNFKQASIDTNSIRFFDKKRERSRQKKLRELRAKQKERANRLKPVKVIKKSEPWSAKKRQNALEKGFDVKVSIDSKSDDEDEWDNEDWEEMQEAKKLKKRLRKGKISQRNFNKQMNTIEAIDDLKQFTASLPSTDSI